MRRTAQGDEFRSNVHRGGTTELVDLDEETEKVAVQAAQTMGLRVAGVDMLESDLGPMVMEVNSSPGLEGIEGATGLDIAGAITDYIANRSLFPKSMIDSYALVVLNRCATWCPIVVTSTEPFRGRRAAVSRHGLLTS